MELTDARPTKPAIRMTDEEADLVADLAVRIEQSSPELSALLMEEIDRAEIVAADALPDNTVRLGSRVEFRNESTGQTREVRLVLPGQADIGQGDISILTFAGAGLIGLTEGQSISWPDANGVERALTVTKVTPPA